MALAVVNYPTLSDEDFGWIQSIRRKYDRLYYEVADPHIPLVFPTGGIDAPILIEHVHRVGCSASPFEVIFRCAILGDPDFEDHAHAFLVPDEGLSGIVRLHDRLYTGPPADFLQLDLPFIPHLGIANTPRPEDCKAIVDELNAEKLEIQCRVETLDIVEYDGEKVRTIERFSLSIGSEQGA